MWADNETTVDLLGFDYLVDSLDVILTDLNLLPITVGVLGDWGSGKSSLLQMVGARLLGSDDYIVVSFSPWRYQGYEDVKASLMEAVLSEVERRIPEGDTERLGLLARLRSKVSRMAGTTAAFKVLAPVLGGLAGAHVGNPAIGVAAGTAAASATQAWIDEGSLTPPEDDSPATFESVAEFREEFERLVSSLDGVKAVVVLIDDLDRCFDETILEVFEAIRLFLQVKATAFVIAANRSIVQAAIERRYPPLSDGGVSVGKDYLEKIVQIEVTVPPLAAAEVETYLNLLFADLRLDAESMENIRAAASVRRQGGEFTVAMNYGIAAEVLGVVAPELQADFVIVNRIAPILGRGLRGNPRQLKRFLNTLSLRLETARRRSINLDPAVLAKLMVLEMIDREFQQLFQWQLEQNGIPEELRIAESTAAASEDLPETTSVALRNWFGSGTVKRWLELEPPLAGVALGQYFFFSRDRLAPAVGETRLSGTLQALLGRLTTEVVAQRRVAVDEATKLPPEELAAIYEVLLQRVGRNPSGPALDSSVELAIKEPARFPLLTSTLSVVPPANIPPALPAQLQFVGKDRPEVKALLDQWAASTVGTLAKSVIAARKGST